MKPKLNQNRSLLKAFRVGVVSAGALLCWSQSFALNVQLFRPVAGQNDRGLTVYGSQGLQKHNLKAGLFFNLTDDPLEFAVPPDTRVDQIVDEFYTVNFLLAYGVTDWLTLHLDAPLNVWSDVEPIANFQNTEDLSMGDLRFSATVSLFKQLDPVSQADLGGVAFIPFFTVALDNTDDFFGDESFTAGGLFAMDWQLFKRHYLAINFGGRYREREDLLNLAVAHEFLLSAAYVARLSCKYQLDWVIEANSSTTFRKFYQEEISSPVELTMALRKRSASKHWESQVGFSRAANNGYGAPDFRLFAGLSYLFFPRSSLPAKHCCEDRPIEKVPEPAPAPQPQPEPEPQPEPAPAPVPVEPEVIVRYIEPIFFDSGKDTIKRESFAALDEVYKIIEEFPDIESVQVEAHTDSQGSETYNLGLSERRARSAKKYLVEKGVAQEKIQTLGFGESKPIETNETAVGRAKNRRVEFFIQSPSQHIKIIQKKD